MVRGCHGVHGNYNTWYCEVLQVVHRSIYCWRITRNQQRYASFLVKILVENCACLLLFGAGWTISKYHQTWRKCRRDKVIGFSLLGRAQAHAKVITCVELDISIIHLQPGCLLHSTGIPYPPARTPIKPPSDCSGSLRLRHSDSFHPQSALVRRFPNTYGGFIDPLTLPWVQRNVSRVKEVAGIYLPGMLYFLPDSYVNLWFDVVVVHGSWVFERWTEYSCLILVSTHLRQVPLDATIAFTLVCTPCPNPDSPQVSSTLLHSISKGFPWSWYVADAVAQSSREHVRCQFYVRKCTILVHLWTTRIYQSSTAAAHEPDYPPLSFKALGTHIMTLSFFVLEFSCKLFGQSWQSFIASQSYSGISPLILINDIRSFLKYIQGRYRLALINHEFVWCVKASSCWTPSIHPRSFTPSTSFRNWISPIITMNVPSWKVPNKQCFSVYKIRDRYVRENPVPAFER